jgi:tape measure domain-containing protein
MNTESEPTIFIADLHPFFDKCKTHQKEQEQIVYVLNQIIQKGGLAEEELFQLFEVLPIAINILATITEKPIDELFRAVHQRHGHFVNKDVINQLVQVLTDKIQEIT